MTMRLRRSNPAYAAMAMQALQLLITVTYNLEQGTAARIKPIYIDVNHLQVRDIPGVVKRMGLHLHNTAAERAFFAKDLSRVSYADFRALWARTEQAKRDEAKLIAEHAPQHTFICNKLLKVGTEAVMYTICKEPAYAHEHLLKFRTNLRLAGRTCRDTGI